MNEAEDNIDAIAKLKRSNDIQFQTLHQRIADICQIIVFSNQSSTVAFPPTGPEVSGLGYASEIATCTRLILQNPWRCYLPTNSCSN